MKIELFTSMLVFSGCMTLSSYAAQADEASLYERLGGAATLTAVVDETIERVAANPRVNQSFDKVNLVRLKQKIVEQLCAISGGPCQYTGDDMKRSHAGMNITEAEFYVLADELVDALKRHDVPIGARNGLLRLLAPMKRDIVTR